MNKKGFTLIETLISLMIFSAVIIISMSLMTLLMKTNQVTVENYKNRTNSFENVLYMIQDIQSAHEIDITNGDKQMKIVYQDGRGEITYEIKEGKFIVNSGEIFNVDQEASKFIHIDDDLVRIAIKLVASENVEKSREFLIDTIVMVRGEP